MAFSVNTNPQAFLALQNNAETNRDLQTTQNRISTGLEVSGAEDDSAAFTIAQRIRADVSGLNAVNDSLDRASSTLEVATTAAETVSDLLVEAQEIATAASDQGLTSADRSALNEDFSAITSQIDNVVNAAEFNGTNLIDGGGDNLNALTDLSGSAGTTISFANTDLTSGTLSVGTVDTQGNAESAITSIDSAIDTVNTQLSNLAAATNQVDLQSEFTNNLQDAFETGVGNLVDANLAEESARLQSLQVQQQLGLSALSIANQQPQSVLSLF